MPCRQSSPSSAKSESIFLDSCLSRMKKPLQVDSTCGKTRRSVNIVADLDSTSGTTSTELLSSTISDLSPLAPAPGLFSLEPSPMKRSPTSLFLQDDTFASMFLRSEERKNSRLDEGKGESTAQMASKQQEGIGTGHCIHNPGDGEVSDTPHEASQRWCGSFDVALQALISSPQEAGSAPPQHTMALEWSPMFTDMAD